MREQRDSDLTKIETTVETKWTIEYARKSDSTVVRDEHGDPRAADSWPTEVRRDAEELRERERPMGELEVECHFGRVVITAARVNIWDTMLLRCSAGELVVNHENLSPAEKTRRLAIFRKLYQLKPDECWDGDELRKLKENECRDDQGRACEIRLIGGDWRIRSHDRDEDPFFWAFSPYAEQCTYGGPHPCADPEQWARVVRYVSQTPTQGAEKAKAEGFGVVTFEAQCLSVRAWESNGTTTACQFKAAGQRFRVVVTPMEDL